jgi:Uma2 family endonuclease
MPISETEHRHTPEEYLASERLAEVRHEFYKGIVYEMASEGADHSLILTNLIGELGNRLKGRDCAVFSPNMKVVADKNTLFAYPDLTVVCGEPLCFDEHRDVLTNPSIIVEIVSKSTEGFDRGEKFFFYRSFIATLTDYIVVSQDLPFIDHFTRETDGQWILNSVHGLNGTLCLQSIDCQINMSEIYYRIPLPPLPDWFPH